MSAYSEWKYGLISDGEYNSICKQEDYEEKERLKQIYTGDGDDEEEEEYLEDDELDEF